jgi:hypothetical protein
LFILLVAGALVIWLALLLSAALTSVSSDLNVFAASDADAATTLNCGTPSCGTGTILDYSFTAPANSWAVVAARSTAANGDPDVCVYSNATYTTLRACSDVSGVNGVVEFVAMDFHRGAGGTNYPRTQRVGSGEVCTQLDCGTLLVPGAAPTSLTWFTGNVVKVFNVPVTAGTTYHAWVLVSSGTSDFGLAAFRSNQVAGYAAGRGSAVALADRRGAGQGEGIYFEATANDTMGLVLWVNNAATSANYRIEVDTATEIPANSPMSFGGTAERDFFYVPSGGRSWTVLALRPQPTSDADLKLYDAPDYLTQLSRSTASVGVVDLIVANYANAPEDTGAVLMGSPGPLGVYLLDWFEHPIAMASGDYVALDLGDRIGTGFTANLVAGSQYRFHFDPDNGTTGDISLMLFGPRAAVPNFKYGTRADSIAGSDVWAAKPAGWNANEGIEQFNFSPTITGQYFLYAYQKTGAPVSGVLRFFPTALLDAPPGPPPGTRVALAAPWPSPARGESVRLRCDLAQAARADLDILDVKGRTVKKAYGGILPAGASVLAWDGRAENGLLAAPGLYYARLRTPLGTVSQVIVWLR